jgi:predicted Zn finger-like uncharacterized protein
VLTRCPECATHFRVTAEQLKLRAGRVRCGECQHVFNALDTLIEEPPVVIAPPAVITPTATPDLGQKASFGEELAAAPAPTFDSTPASTDGSGGAELQQVIESAETLDDVRESRTPEPVAEDPPAQAETETPTVEPVAEGQPPIRPTQDYSAREPEPWEDAFGETPPPRRWPWAVGTMLALLVLGLQAILMYRVEIAVLWPESRSLLVAACQMIGCEVTLPAKVALVGIEASDLHPDTAQKGRLALTATLKNRAPFAQHFPHLELTLTDTADKAIVRKVLPPAEYLPHTATIANGMAPNADIAISVTLDAGELPASGYRLYIFYP